MKTRVCTLMWGTAWDRYGRAFAETFGKHWPEDVELSIVTDKPLPTERATQIDLGGITGYRAFMETWGEDRRAQGYGCTDRKADPAKRFWKRDAVKWGPQGLAPRACLEGLETGDILAWFDADVETTRDVPAGWLDTLLDGHDVACLQRPAQHSEIGFYAVRIGPATRRFLDLFGDIYASGRFIGLPETHSAYVFDEALSTFRLKIRNLNKANIRGHVWPLSPLSEYTKHKKGKMK